MTFEEQSELYLYSTWAPWQALQHMNALHGELSLQRTRLHDKYTEAETSTIRQALALLLRNPVYDGELLGRMVGKVRQGSMSPTLLARAWQTTRNVESITEAWASETNYGVPMLMAYLTSRWTQPAYSPTNPANIPANLLSSFQQRHPEKVFDGAYNKLLRTAAITDLSPDQIYRFQTEMLTENLSQAQTADWLLFDLEQRQRELHGLAVANKSANHTRVDHVRSLLTLDTPHRRWLFTEQWLPKLLSAAEFGETATINPQLLVQLYPLIYAHGPELLAGHSEDQIREWFPEPPL